MKYVRSVDLDGWAVDCMRTKCETPITPILTVLTECGVTQKSQPQKNIAKVPNETNFYVPHWFLQKETHFCENGNIKCSPVQTLKQISLADLDQGHLRSVPKIVSSGIRGCILGGKLMQIGPIMPCHSFYTAINVSKSEGGRNILNFPICINKVATK